MRGWLYHCLLISVALAFVVGCADEPGGGQDALEVAADSGSGLPVGVEPTDPGLDFPDVVAGPEAPLDEDAPITDADDGVSEPVSEPDVEADGGDGTEPDAGDGTEPDAGDGTEPDAGDGVASPEPEPESVGPSPADVADGDSAGDVAPAEPDVELPPEDVVVVDQTFVVNAEGVKQGDDGAVGSVIVPAGTFAVFPLFSWPETKVVESLGPDTLFLTKVENFASCMTNEALAGLIDFLPGIVVNDEGLVEFGPDEPSLVGAINQQGPFDSAVPLDVGSVLVAMLSEPENGAVYPLGNYCFGVRRTDGVWVFDFDPHEPFEEVNGGIGLFSAGEATIDMIAILFESEAAVPLITFEASTP